MKEKPSLSSLSNGMEIEQTEAREFSLHYLATTFRLFFFLEIVILTTLVFITVVDEISYEGLLAGFYVGLIVGFLWSLIGIWLNVKFARIRVDSDAISGHSFWGKRKQVYFSEIDKVKVFNLVTLKLLRITSPNATIWSMAHLATPNQFYAAVEEAAGPQNLLCVALKKLGLPFPQPKPNEKAGPSKRKVLAISFGLFFFIISILVWGFGVINVFFLIENSLPPDVLSGGGSDQCSSVVTLNLAWINLIWSFSLLIGAFVPTIMIWKDYNRKSVVLATVLGLAQNTFTFVFGISFLYAACF